MAGRENPKVQYKCSFCGKEQHQVHRLIAGPGGVYICDTCVDLCNDIIHEEAGNRVPPPLVVRSGEEELRNKTFSSAGKVQVSVAARDYKKAVTAAESLLEDLRALREQTQPGAELE